MSFIEIVDAVYIPAEVDELTDEEIFDEDCEKNNEHVDIAGTFEIHTADDDSVYDDSDDETLADKRRKLLSVNECLDRKPDWKEGEYVYNKNNDFENKEKENITRLKNELEGKTPLDLFFMFFDDEIITDIIQYTQKYARDNNRHDFTIDKDDLLKFLGIMILSGYHTLPQADLYWSTEEDKGLKIVRDCMSRNRFRNIKRNIHLFDNNKLDKNDKFTKLRPFFDQLNKKFMQFGVFSTNLSIDEQMVPYFGRHSCKMYLKGKPVRFGFKLWCLCSSGGYLYQFIPYAGASTEKSPFGLGGQVVLNLLSVTDKKAHRVFFDNFFSSYKLMSVLTGQGYFATGTIRENRTLAPPLMPIKVISKMQRGSYSSAYDKSTGISLVRWNDNSVVTLISNYDNVQPLNTTKRYNRKEKKMENISQPAVILEYNKFMGGVDLHDNAIANYRTRILGKKWWWPLFSNAIDSTIVNAWKIFNIVHEKKMSQLDFKSYIAYRLLKIQCQDGKESTSRVPSSTPFELRTDKVGHIITQEDRKARRRCRVCHSATIYMCKKCNVHIHANCFEAFHKK